jgi:hypothetical protein
MGIGLPNLDMLCDHNCENKTVTETRNNSVIIILITTTTICEMRYYVTLKMDEAVLLK